MSIWPLLLGTLENWQCELRHVFISRSTESKALAKIARFCCILRVLIHRRSLSFWEEIVVNYDLLCTCWQQALPVEELVVENDSRVSPHGSWESSLKNTITFLSIPGNSGCHILSDCSNILGPKCDIMISPSKYFLINWLRVNVLALNCSIFWRMRTFICAWLCWGRWVLSASRSSRVLVYIFASHYLMEL